MKRLLCMLSALVLICGALSACSYVKQSVGSFSVGSFSYNGSTYSRAQDWDIDPDDADFRTDKVTVGDTDYDIKVYGKNDDFIVMVISGDEYHNDALPFPSNTPDRIQSIDAIYMESTVSSSDEQTIANFCNLLVSDKYTTDALTGARYLCSFNIAYKNCPAACAVGAALGVEDRYYLRLDCVDGADISENPRYYPISADFFF